MPAATTHPAANRVYPNVDHVQAWSLGGAWDDLGNLLTACTPCNERKSNNLGWLKRTNELTAGAAWCSSIDRLRKEKER